MNAVKKIALPAFLLTVIVLLTACVQSAPGAPPSSTAQPSQSSNNQDAISAVPSEEEIKGVASYDRNFLIVFDDSGSMGENSCGGNAIQLEVSPGKFSKNRIGVAKWATSKFSREWVPVNVNLGFYPLNNSKYRIPLGKDNRSLVLDAVDLEKRESITANGGTPLNRALREATEILVEQRKLQLGYGEYYIVVVTDGEATDDGGKDAKAGAEYALQNNIMIITIGFCFPQGHALSKHSVSYRNALNAEQLFEALKETQAELPEYDSK